MTSGPLFRILRNGLWGFIDAAGGEVIPCEFAWASEFSEGCAAVEVHPRRSLLRLSKRVAIPGNYGKPALLHETGKITLLPAEPMGGPVNGRLILKAGVTLGIADAEGRFVGPPVYDSIEPFREGLAIVEKEGRYGAVNPDGTLTIPLQYRHLSSFSNGLAPVSNGEGLWGYIDTSGRLAVPFQFARTFPFREGLGLVTSPESYKLGYIHPDGKPAIDCRFDWADSFSSGLAAASLEPGRIGFINSAGDWAIAPEYAAAGPIGDGRAPFTRDREKIFWGYIDVTGQPVIPPAYPAAHGFIHGRALVHHGSDDLNECRSAYIDRNNNVIWDGGDTWYPG